MLTPLGGVRTSDRSVIRLVDDRGGRVARGGRTATKAEPSAVCGAVRSSVAEEQRRELGPAGFLLVVAAFALGFELTLLGIGSEKLLAREER